MTELSDKVHALRNQGYTYNAIVAELGCSKGYVAHCVGEGQKQKTLDNQKRRRAENSLIQKADRFKNYVPAWLENVKQNQLKRELSSSYRHKVHRYNQKNRRSYSSERAFTLAEFYEKIGENPTCYLTGKPIDLLNPRSFNLDHKHPRSRGGDNSLDNLGVALREVNSAKGDLTVSEFTQLCIDVLIHHGYTVTK